jgi:peptide chain release factor 3
MGYDFKGIYNLSGRQNVNLFSGDSRKDIEETIEISDFIITRIRQTLVGGKAAAYQLRDEHRTC